MAGSSVSVVIYDSRITAMNYPGGDVYKYFLHKARTTVALAKVLAPKRTGELARSVRREAPRSGRNHVTMRVSARAKHAIFVIKGTGQGNGGWIDVDTTAEGYFWIPKYPHSAKRVKRFEDVRGQEANNFLDDAMQSALNEPYWRGARLTGNPFG